MEMETKNTTDENNTKVPSSKSNLSDEILNRPVDNLPSIWLSKRFFVTIIIFLCFVNSTFSKRSMSIAIVDMTSSKVIVTDNGTITRESEFNWDSNIVALILSIFFYGGLFSFWGGFVVLKIGGLQSSVLSLVISGIMTLMYPFTIRRNLYLYLICRFITGVCDNILYMGFIDMFSHWIPKQEKSTLMAFALNGLYVGLVINHTLCGFLAQYWGWTMIFYVMGIISLILAILGFTLLENSPSADKRISRKELLYILQGTDYTRGEKINTSYKRILLSVPVWALCISKLTYGWLLTFIFSSLPLYIRDATHMEIDEIGLISSLPNVVFFIMFPLGGVFIDFWKNRSTLPITWIHKILCSGGFISSSVIFAAPIFIYDFTIFMALFTLLPCFLSFSALINQLMAICIAPNHSSAVAGLTSLWMYLGVTLSQTVTGFMIVQNSLQEWNNYFLLSATISLCGASIVIIFGSSKPESWSLPDIKQECSTEENINFQRFHFIAKNKPELIPNELKN